MTWLINFFRYQIFASLPMNMKTGLAGNRFYILKVGLKKKLRIVCLIWICSVSPNNLERHLLLFLAPFSLFPLTLFFPQVALKHYSTLHNFTPVLINFLHDAYKSWVKKAFYSAGVFWTNIVYREQEKQ